jgi:hypothetical protein
MRKVASYTEGMGNVQEPEDRFDEILARIECDLDHLRDGLALVGVKPCCWCRKFFRYSNNGALFDCGELVCYGCVPEWWQRRRTELSVEDREVVERKLTRWLLNHHHATVIRQSAKLPESQRQELRIVVACQECRGTGKLRRERCRYCDGRGTVWVVIPKQES